MSTTPLDRYARLLVEHGAGLRPGQPLFLHGETAHRDLALRIAEAGYDLGASDVSFWLRDPRERAQRIRRGSLAAIELSHEQDRRWFNEILVRGGALISLRGDEFPRLMSEVAQEFPERHTLFNKSANYAREIFLAHGINRSLAPWVVAAAPTVGWAQLVFPELDDTQALERLTAEVLRLTRADQEDPLAALAETDRRLHRRRELLDDLAIRELRIVGGGSDLRIALSSEARWLGGSKTTASGQRFNANVPTEENFTTPDRRHTRGRLRTTMPFRLRNGALVEGLEMKFEDGRLVDFSATGGAEAFRQWIDQDEGARQLGEVALVGQDSPIAQSGIFFEHTLLDENASVHVALGQAYATALEGGSSASAAQLDALGYNRSVIHTDIMVGSTEVSVIATESARGEVPLLEDGHWVGSFA